LARSVYYVFHDIAKTVENDIESRRHQNSIPVHCKLFPVLFEIMTNVRGMVKGKLLCERRNVAENKRDSSL